jgi:uncharacterized protein (TIGR02217 family)
MTFHNIRFPTRISYGAIGGPRFSTTIQTLNSGHEQRNINWADARREFQFDVSPSRNSEWEEILNFFHARRGRAFGFRLKDFADFQLKDGLVALGDGAKKDFQIKKQYSDLPTGLYSYDRALSKIVQGSATVFLGTAAQFGNWSLNADTGVLSFSQAPADQVEIRVSCEFDVPVRFDSDLMEAAIPGPDIHHWQQVKLVEIRV